jgi:hypothetical protein
MVSVVKRITAGMWFSRTYRKDGQKTRVEGEQRRIKRGEKHQSMFKEKHNGHAPEKPHSSSPLVFAFVLMMWKG